MTAINRAIRGRKVKSFRIVDNVVCQILFDAEFVLTSETLLRFLGTNGDFITAEDHNQKFGLPRPFDAEAAISSEIVGKEIRAAEVCPKTGDLRLLIEGGVIEIIASSSGYESYQLTGSSDFIIVGNGGKQQAEQGRHTNPLPVPSPNLNEHSNP